MRTKRDGAGPVVRDRGMRADFVLRFRESSNVAVPTFDHGPVDASAVWKVTAPGSRLSQSFAVVTLKPYTSAAAESVKSIPPTPWPPLAA